MSDPQPEYSAIEKAYLEAAIGSKPPQIGMAPGRTLNALLNVTDYEPDRVYLFDEYGIYPLED